jgi:membrane-associated protein
MLAGGLGAIVGDSTLFLIARRSSSFVEPQLARARKNPKVQGAFDFLDRGAPMRLLTDRYVPGLRFVVNATLGISDMHTGCSCAGRHALVVYTCGLAYLVGSALDDLPPSFLRAQEGADGLAAGAVVASPERRRELAGCAGALHRLGA